MRSPGLCVAIAFALAFACSSKSPTDEAPAKVANAASTAPPASTPPAPSTAPATSNSPAPSSAATPSNTETSRRVPRAPPPAPAKTQLVQARKHMKAGWALQRKKQWALAVAEFEAALAQLENDPRALAELGWSAMNAGDLPKARKADEAAITVATDPKLKAASLYNLGKVQLRLGDTDAARRSFTASLVLRPNQTVEHELASLGGNRDPDPDPALCATGQEPCACILANIVPAPERCARSQSSAPVPGWHLYHTATRSDEADYLFDEHDQLVTMISGAEDSHNYTTTTLENAELKTISGHRIVWLDVRSVSTVQTMQEQNVTNDHRDTLTTTICAIGDAKTATRCLRELPRSTTHDHEVALMSDTGDITPEKQTTTSTALDITLADDGVVSVKLANGNTSDLPANLLGPHHLW